MGGTVTQFSIEPPDQTATKFEVEPPSTSGEAPATPGFLKQLIAPYNPGAEDLNPALRFLDQAGGALLGAGPAVYHAFADEPTEEENKKFKGDTGGLKRVGLGIQRLVVDPVASAAEDYASGKVTPKAALDVLPEALGAGTGTFVASEAGGRALSKVGEFRTQMGGGPQGFARKFTGVESALKDEVTKAAEKQGVAEVKHAEATGDVAARQDVAKKLDQSSVKLSKHLERVENSVAKEADAKFKAVREKLGITEENPGPEVPPDQMVETVRDIEENVLQNIPENVKEFRAVLGHGEEAAPGMRAAFKEATGKEALGGKPFTWDELQSLKSRIDARLRKSRGMNGDLKRGLRQLRDQTVDEMGGIAEPAGASDLWNDARAFYRNYKTDFHEPTGPSGSGSPVAKALDAVDPKMMRQPFTGAANSSLGNRGVDILRKYPQHGGNEAAAAVEEMLGHHESLRRMPDKAAPKPLQAPVVDASLVARKAIARRAARWGDFNARDMGILASGGLGELIGGLFGGNLIERVGGALAGVGAYEGGKYVGSRLMNKPEVIEWLSRTPPEEIAAINKIPGADKVKIINALTAQAVGSKVELSPAAKQLLGPANVARIMGASAGMSTVHNRKEALELMGR
jgi:hypothetical protein